MGMSVNSNISALNAGRQMNKVQMSLGKSFERLSSGLRINRAADDAGGLKISERFTSQIRGLNQAIRNANDGISLVQTAEGALNETTNILQRMRELAVQSANGTFSDTDRASLNEEAQALIQEIDRIAVNTTFNGKKILDGSFVGATFQIGSDAGQTLSLSVDGAEADDFGRIARSTGAAAVDASGIGDSELQINGAQIKNSGGFAASNGRGADSAFAKALAINSSAANVRAEATSATLDSAQGSTLDGSETLTLNGVTILDGTQGTNVDSYTELASTINAFSSQTGVTATLNTAGDQISLSTADGRNIEITAADGTGANPFTTGTTRGNIKLTSTSNISLSGTTARIGFGGVSSVALDSQNIRGVSIASVNGATDAIDRIDSALDSINTNRGKLGAVQNRLESTISNLSNVHENLSAARSRLLDVDFASETVSLTRGQMLQQAGAAMLSQSKASSQIALQLLQ